MKAPQTQNGCSESIEGCLVGMAVGDSIGLPYEGMKPARAKRFAREKFEQRLVFGHGMISDDTEHSCMVAQALIQHPGDVASFLRCLAWKLRWWLLALPAGLGMATLKSIVRLWFGVRPEASGVFSAGNGPCMRSPILGVFFASDASALQEFVQASSRITHSDPKAHFGALIVAIAASLACRQSDVELEEFESIMASVLPEEAEELLELLRGVCESVRRGEDLESYLHGQSMEVGISGYTYHTVPAVIHSWLRHQRDFEAGITEIVRCGGDTDTSAAILGGIIGARVGATAIPDDWKSAVADWPRSLTWIRRVAHRLGEVSSDRRARAPIPLSQLGVVFRNAGFFAVVLFHGFRRLFPPYS